MNKVPKNDDQVIAATDCLFSLFGRRISEDTTYLKEEPLFKKFNAALGTIHTVGLHRGLAVGEQLAMISQKFGFSWHTVPFGRIEEIKQYLIDNAFRKIEILSPDFHKKLMVMSPEVPGVAEYQKQFRVTRTEEPRRFWDN